MPQDDSQVFKIKRDLSGGANSRQHGRDIQDNQVITLYNADISIGGQTTKRKGLTSLSDLGASAGTGLFGFEPDGGNNELFATLGVDVFSSISATSAFSSQTSAFASAFTSNLPTTMIKAGMSGQGDIIILSNGTNEPYRILQNYTCSGLGVLNTSPPKTTAMVYFRNRLWAYKSNLLYFSDAYPTNYSLAFDQTTNAFRVPAGSARALLAIRDLGIVAIGADGVYGLNPSLTPSPTTDKPEKVLDIGCVAGNTAVQVGDDIYYMTSDGVRGIFRTQQDKLQAGQTFPLSYVLKTEFDTISWGSISKACAVYFDNKYFIALPTSTSTYNNQVWIYTPATQGWVVITGWNVASWAKMKVSGEERLFYIDSTDGIVNRAWYGYDDAGTAIDYQEVGRKEDMGQPLVKKIGDVIEIKANDAGNYNVEVSVATDDGGWNLLGTINLSGNVPLLPVTIPFVLSAPSVVSKKFHIDNLGEWNYIQYKLRHNATNTTDITIYERTITAYPISFEGE